MTTAKVPVAERFLGVTAAERKGSYVRVLLAGEGTEVLNALTSALISRECHVDRVGFDDDVLDLVPNSDIVLLDGVSPREHRLLLCRQIRAASDARIVVLGPWTENGDRLRWLRAGADDYLLLPYEVDVLIARAQRARHHRRHGMPVVVRQRGVLAWRDVRIDLDARAVTVRRRRVRLNSAEFDLLAILAAAQGAVCTRKRLLIKLWNRAGRQEEYRLYAYVANIRVKLRHPEVIKTVRGVGYRLGDPPPLEQVGGSAMEGHELAEAHVRYASIDDCLGAGSERFFGTGYKHVSHDIEQIHIAPANRRIGARVSLQHSTDWFTTRQRELSSIDAIVIGVQLAEAYLTRAFRFSADQRRRMWVSDMRLRMGVARHAAVDSVVAELRYLGTVTNNPAGCGVSRFSGWVGAIRVSCAVEHCRHYPIIPDEFRGSLEQLLGDARCRHYGRGFKQRDHRIDSIEIDPAMGWIRGRLTVSGPGSGSREGLGAYYRPGLTMIDCAVGMTQLAQALLYEFAGIERAAVGALWIRRLTMSSYDSSHQPLSHPVEVSWAVAHTNTLDAAGRTWRMSDLRGRFGEMDVFGSIAFETDHRTG